MSGEERQFALLNFLKIFEKEMNDRIDFSRFDDRIKFQQIVYIAKYFGVDLGYDFDSYIRSPYSKELAEDYFLIAEIVGRDKNVINEFVENFNVDNRDLW